MVMGCNVGRLTKFALPPSVLYSPSRHLSFQTKGHKVRQKLVNGSSTGRNLYRNPTHPDHRP